MEHMLQPKRRYLGDKNTFLDLEALHTMHMDIAVRLSHARRKDVDDQAKPQKLPAVGDAVLLRNHSKTGWAANFLPGYRVVKVIDKNNYVVKHSITGRTSQVHLKHLIVQPMVRQVLNNLPPVETFGRMGKYPNCPQLAAKNMTK